MLVAVLTGSVLFGASQAGADEPDESTVASELVRQAIALIVNTPDNVEAAREKVGDALKVDNREGVDIALVRDADDALAAGDLHQARTLLDEQANASVRRIADDVWSGQLVGSVHFWAAQAMYVLAGLHLLRVFLSGSSKRPREANWLIGVTMFALVIGALFTGTVIKWDQDGFETLAHNLEIGELLGGAGFWFSAQFSAELPLIVRLYVAHVAIIPELILGALAVHFLLVKRHGVSPHPAIADAPAEPRESFTHHLRRLGAFGLALVGVLIVLAALFPPGLGPTPVEGIEVTRPLWMFWWLFTLENWWGLDAILWATARSSCTTPTT